MIPVITANGHHVYVQLSLIIAHILINILLLMLNMVYF